MKTKTILIALIAMFIVTALNLQSCKKHEPFRNESPTCVFTSPLSGQEIQISDSVTFSVETNDSDGHIIEVRYSVDGKYKGSGYAPYFNYIWTTYHESIGNHTIEAKCKDNNGGSSYDEISVEIVESGNTLVADVPQP